MQTKTITQTALFQAQPLEVFNLLATSKGHKAFTGYPARITPKKGSNFSVYDYSLNGIVVKVVKNKQLTLSWQCEMKGWPKTHYSQVDFTLIKTKTGTKLSFKQTGVPSSCYADIRDGWKEYYWTPIKDYLAKNK